MKWDYDVYCIIYGNIYDLKYENGYIYEYTYKIYGIFRNEYVNFGYEKIKVFICCHLIIEIKFMIYCNNECNIVNKILSFLIIGWMLN